MYCRKCGARISESAKFCTKCGTAVRKGKGQNAENNVPISPQTEAQTNVQMPAQANVSTSVQASAPIHNPMASVGNQAENTDASQKKPITLGLILLVCILAVIVGGLIFLKLKNEGGETEEAVNGEVSEATTEGSEPESIEEAESTPEPKTVEMLLEEGKTYLVNNNYAGAKKCYEDAKALDAGNEAVYLYGADLYLLQDNFTEALKILDEGILASNTEKLKLRKDYIVANVVIKEQTSNYYYGNVVYEYDEFGNLIRDFYKEYAYDEKGNLIEETFYDEEGNFVEKIGYKYDSTGKLIQMMHYSESGNALGWTQYEYAPGGEIVNEVYYDENGQISYWFGYAYNADGIVEKKIYHESDGDIAYWYEYDAAGNQLREIHNSSNGKVNWWNELVYDEKGNVLSEVEYDYRGKVNWRGEYSYDANGNRIKSVTYNKDDTISDWREHVYDREGKILKSTNYKYDGTPYMWVEYTYDENGNEIKYTEYNENGIATDWRESAYTIDGNGNTTSTVYDEKGQVESKKTVNSMGYVVSEYVAAWDAEYNYNYTYIGDIISTNEVSETSGTLKVADNIVLYRRRIPYAQAAYVMHETGGSYQVVGETEEFYLLVDGWYVAKDHKGITFTES